MKIIKNSLIAISSIAALAILNGCSNSNSGGVKSFSGTAVDGYLANGKVYYEGFENEYVITDSKGNFNLTPNRNRKIILEPIYDENNNSTTIDITTGTSFDQVLSAPANYNIITPLTTVLAETNITVEQLAKELDLNVTTAESMLKLDPVDVMQNSDTTLYSDAQKEQASKIYTQGVVLEKQLNIILSDKKTFDDINTSSKLDSKSIVISALFKDAIKDENTSFANISSNTISEAYKSAVATKTKSAFDNSAEANASALFISSAAANLNNGLEDINYTESDSGYHLATEIAKISDELVDVSKQIIENNITDVSKEIVAAEYTAEAATIQAKANTQINNDGNKTAIQNLLVQAQSALILSEDTYKESNNSVIKINPAPTITVDVNKTHLSTADTNTTIAISLSDEDKDGKDVSSFAKYTAVIDDGSVIGLPNSKTLFTSNSKTLQVTIKKAGSTKLHLVPIDNKNKTGQEQTVEFSIYNETDTKKTPLIMGEQSPITFESTSGVPKELKRDLTLGILDDNGDGALKQFSVDSNDTNVVKVIYNKNDTISLYPVYNGTAIINLNAVDVNNKSTTSSFQVSVTGVSLPPVLSLLSEASKALDVMVTDKINYIWKDPDKDTNVSVYATSSDENIATVAVDKTNEQIIVTTQPKVGATTISVWAKDSVGLKSKIKTVKYTTINKQFSLFKSLRVVPAFTNDMNLVDSRYEMNNFSANYNIADETVSIIGDINSSYHFNDFVLNLDANNSMYGNADSSKSYGLVLNMNYTDSALKSTARVLEFSTSENKQSTKPYIWALATPSEICAAYKGTTAIDMINSYNANNVVCP